MKIRLPILLSILISVTFAGFAQEYDDIYYDSSKTKKKEATKKTKSSAIEESPDSSIIYRDVDEYNRRYTSNIDTIAYDSISEEKQGYFIYTDRIRRFHNPTVIIETNNPELAEVYYVSTTPSVNLIIGTPSYYWGSPYWYDWYYPYSWRTGWYGPSWYSSWYGWNWSFGWTWGTSHFHHHHWYPGHIHHPVHGTVSGGIQRPDYRPGGNRYTGAGSNIGIGRRPSTPPSNRNNSTSVSGGTTRRPGVSGSSTNSGDSRRQGNKVSSSDKRKNNSQEKYTNSNSNRQSRRSSYSSGSDNNRSRGGFSGGGSRSGGGRGGRR